MREKGKKERWVMESGADRDRASARRDSSLLSPCCEQL